MLASISRFKNSFVNSFHKIANLVIRKLQSLLGLITIGPRAIVLNAENKVLLVKHSYQPHWYLPGGGLKKGESVKDALVRELKEEVGLISIEEPQLFGIYFHRYLNVCDYPIIFIIKKYNLINASSPEIEQMAWFDYHNLPEMISPGTKRRLAEYFKNAIPSENW